MDNHLKNITTTAREVLLKTGKHYPQLFLFTTTGNATLLFADFPEDYDQKIEAFTLAGIKLAKDREIGNLTEVYFMSEGWTGTPEQYKKTGKRPSEQLGRKEILIVIGKIIKDNTMVSSISQPIRDIKGKIIEVRELNSEGVTFNSPFIDAFLMAYIVTRLKVLHIQN